MDRTCKILKEGQWVDRPFDDLREGDLFQLIEPTGELVVGMDGRSVLRATSDVYSDDTGLARVNSVYLEREEV